MTNGEWRINIQMTKIGCHGLRSAATLAVRDAKHGQPRLRRSRPWHPAIDNAEGLRDARRKLMETNFDPDLLADFAALPENVATLDAMAETNDALGDETKRERIITGWQRYFREKFARIARE